MSIKQRRQIHLQPSSIKIIFMSISQNSLGDYGVTITITNEKKSWKVKIPDISSIKKIFGEVKFLIVNYFVNIFTNIVGSTFF